ncbi:MAG: hypothetical protein ACM3ST_03325 [Bdellovibrio bacteriovorus]
MDAAGGGLRAGAVIHTLGCPLTFRQLGGGFIYGYQNNQANIFRSADLGVVRDYLEIFPPLIEKAREGFSFGLRRGQ